MKRLTIRLSALAALAGLGLLASACNLEWSSYAARVGNDHVSTGELNSAMSHASRNSAFKCLLEGSSQKGYRLAGAGSDTYDSAFAAFILTDLIDSRLAGYAVRAAHIKLPAEGEKLAYNQVREALSAQASQAGCSSGAAKDLLAGLGSSLSSSFVRLQLYEDALAARAANFPLSAAGIRAFERAHAPLTQENCLTGIFVASKSVADGIEHQIASGTSFSALVQKYSKSATSSAGPLGCYTLSQLQGISPAIASAVSAAKVGQVMKPVFYKGTQQAAYLVAEVTSQRYEPIPAALNELFSSETSAFAKAITAAAHRVHIYVDPRYGSWQRQTSKGVSAGAAGRVVPNKGPADAYVLNPSAVMGHAQVRLNPAGTGIG